MNNCIVEENVSNILWSIAIFTAREQPSELLATIVAAMQASSKNTVIDVMVNGNLSLADNICKNITTIKLTVDSPLIRVWFIKLGGKAHAWNQYVHQVWPGSKLAFFIDGYARISTSAMSLLSVGMSNAADAIAGTGVPSSGSTAVKLREDTLREGGLHGAFFAIKEDTMLALRQRSFRLPLGLYGFDTLLGAVLAFGLDPSVNEWNPKKCIFVHPDVTWIIDEKKWWRYSVIKTQFNRIQNNALRKLVVGATKDHLAKRKMRPEKIPRTIEEFIFNWVTANPDEAKATLIKYPLCRLILRKLSEPRDWSAADIAPKLIFSTHSVFENGSDGYIR